MPETFAIFVKSAPSTYRIHATFRTAAPDFDDLVGGVTPYSKGIRRQCPEVYADRSRVDFVVLETAEFWTAAERRASVDRWKHDPAGVAAAISRKLSPKIIPSIGKGASIESSRLEGGQEPSIDSSSIDAGARTMVPDPGLAAINSLWCSVIAEPIGARRWKLLDEFEEALAEYDHDHRPVPDDPPPDPNYMSSLF